MPIKELQVVKFNRALQYTMPHILIMVLAHKASQYIYIHIFFYVMLWGGGVLLPPWQVRWLNREGSTESIGELCWKIQLSYRNCIFFHVDMQCNYLCISSFIRITSYAWNIQGYQELVSYFDCTVTNPDLHLFSCLRKLFPVKVMFWTIGALISHFSLGNICLSHH